MNDENTITSERPSVLVVDDDADIRNLARAALERAGFTVAEAENGRVALRIFEAMRPDVVLLDILMPEFDGHQTCVAIRQLPQGTHTPIVMMTALDDEASIRRAYDIGATDFIVKPMNHLLMVHRLSYVLRANRYLIHFDPLTGLPNRTLLLEHVEGAIASAQRYQRNVALVLVDLDRFKRFNETLGYVACDAMLVEVAKRLQPVVRNSDWLGRNRREDSALDLMSKGDGALARLGGDEFVILLTELRRVDDLAQVIRRIESVFMQPFHFAGDALHITASIGVSTYPLDADDSYTLLKHAEVAMNHAKEKGRNQHQFYTKALNIRTQKRFTLETRLRRAIETDGLEVHYQPKIDIQHDRLAGMEALVRWRDPELGMVSPIEFIPIAEDTGLILPLGEWVFLTACAQGVERHEAGQTELIVSINISPAQFRQKGLARRIEHLLASTGLEPRFVELELTEGTMLEDVDSSIATLNDLKAIGLSIAIDDFGTGYSSFSYLKRIPMDVLKIDQSFIHDLAGPGKDADIVSAMVALGHTLGLCVVAEGVENKDQLEFLRTSACDQVQGYYISRPLPGDEFAAWTSTWQTTDPSRPALSP